MMPENWNMRVNAVVSRLHYVSLHQALFKYWFGSLVEIWQKFTHLRQRTLHESLTCGYC